MAWNDPAARVEALRGWFSLVADGKGAERAKEMLDIAGELYDEGNLDGSQYALIFDLGRALRSPEVDDPAQVARRCLDQI